MAKRSKKTKVEDLIDPVAENATSASEVAVLDHSTQTSSWSESLTQSMTDMVTEIVNEGAVEAVTDAELEAAIEAMSETVIETEAVDPAPAAVQPSANSDYDATLALIPEAQVEEQVFKIAGALDTRVAFETAKDADNSNIHRTLKKARSLMVTKRAARVLLASNVDPEVINRQVHTGNAYNVYAIGKLADVIYGLTGGAISNKINFAIMKSMFRFRAAGIAFTGEMAKAAASDKVRVDAAIRRHLISHTVSASTAPTQASSTMQALETLGIVKRTGGQKNSTYELTDTPIVHKLEQLLAA